VPTSLAKPGFKLAAVELRQHGTEAIEQLHSMAERAVDSRMKRTLLKATGDLILHEIEQIEQHSQGR